MALIRQKRRVQAWGLALAAVCALTAAGCGGGGNGGFTPGAALTGGYGGSEPAPASTPAALALTATGGSLILPCGTRGTLSAPLVPDATGHAVAQGTFDANYGGPSPPGGLPPGGNQATYTATVTGKRITLVLKMASSTDTTTFNLVRGQTADVTSIGCPG